MVDILKNGVPLYCHTCEGKHDNYTMERSEGRFASDTFLHQQLYTFEINVIQQRICRLFQ